MNLTPTEQAALETVMDPGKPCAVHTVISGFETDADAVFLLVPVPVGPDYAVGDRITITLEETP